MQSAIKILKTYNVPFVNKLTVPCTFSQEANTNHIKHANRMHNIACKFIMKDISKGSLGGGFVAMDLGSRYWLESQSTNPH